MKLKIEESLDIEETEITIKCAYVDEKLNKLIAQIRSCTSSLIGIKDGSTHHIPLLDIHYFESIHEKTYIYCGNDVYECSKKLYELEAYLRNTSFVRISKFCIVNTGILVRVHPLFDGKFEAFTIHGKTLVVNRHYVKQFKEKFGI